MSKDNLIKEIIEWLIEFEYRASRFYRKASEYFSKSPQSDKWLSRLAVRLSEDEIYHAHIIDNASKYFTTAGDHFNLLELDKKSKELLEKSLSECEQQIDSGLLTKSQFLETIIKAEYSEWNTYLLYIVNSIKDETSEFANVPKEMQAHKDRIVDYIKGMDYSEDPDHDMEKLLIRLSTIPDMWKEKFLLAVDGNDIILGLLKSILESKGAVDSASNGKEALEHCKNNIYDVVITDINMPVMCGIEFYKEAVKLDPELSKKTIFFTGLLDEEAADFLRKEKIMYLKKPAHINDIIGAVNEILEGSIELDKA